MSRIIKICFPQVVFETREVEVPDDCFPEGFSHEDKVEFIFNQLPSFEQEWIGAPGRDEKEQKQVLSHAFDADCIYIKSVQSSPPQ